MLSKLLKWLLGNPVPPTRPEPITKPPKQRRPRRPKEVIEAEKVAWIEWRKEQVKANAKESRERMLSAGIKRYKWVSSNDERVCQACRENNGKVFYWDGPPPSGHPGEVSCCSEPYCRCSASRFLIGSSSQVKETRQRPGFSFGKMKGGGATPAPARRCLTSWRLAGPP